MRYVFFVNTPAQAHMYRGAVSRLADAGHDPVVLAREYGCTTTLLDYHDVPYQVYGARTDAQWSWARRMPRHFAGAVRLARHHDPDVVFGKGVFATVTGTLLRVPAVVVVDSEPVPIEHTVSRFAARTILSPAAFGRDLGPNHHRFHGFKESAYLHPDAFDPDPSVREALGLAPDERFALLRFNAFNAHHDVGRSGIAPADRRTLVDRLSEELTVLVSAEGDTLDALSDGAADDVRAFDVHPARWHDALAEASLVVADTQTTVTEAALLGTPAVRSNSFVGDDDMGNFRELEAQGLVRNVETFEETLEVALSIARDPSTADRWRRRRDDYVAETVDLTGLLVEVAENGGTVGTAALDGRATATDAPVAGVPGP